MFNINGVDFTINKKGFNVSLADLKIAKINYEVFLRKHTSLSEDELRKITEVMPYTELVEFVYSKLDLNNEKTFIDLVNKFTVKAGSIEYMIVNSLIGFGYKYTDIIKLGSQELVEAFIFEIINKGGINLEALKQRMSEYYSENTIKAFLDLTGLNVKAEQEQSDLITKLNEL